MKYEVRSGDARQGAYRLPDGPVTVVRWPGVPEPGAATEALCAAARRIDAQRVFVTGPGSTATALWAARSGASVVFWTENAASAASLEASFAQNNLPAPRCFVQTGFDGMATSPCAAAFVHLPRGAALQEEALRLAASMLRPNGQMVFVGAKNEGVRGAVTKARRIFGRAGIVTRKGGYHAGLAQRPEGNFPLPSVERTEAGIAVDGVPTRLIGYAGTFAPQRLDDGAASLVAGMQIAQDAQVLDLGCGTGLAGLTAIRRGAHVTFTDVSARAVASTHDTLSANGCPGVPVHLACGAASEAAATFDTVVTNPPFHQGHDVTFDVSRLFVAEAARVLKANGRIYLVANAFLKYDQWLHQHFRVVEVVWEDRRFKVWQGIK